MDKLQIVMKQEAQKTADLLIYRSIGKWDGQLSAEAFVTTLLSLEQQGYQVRLRVNSPGGDVYEGIAIFNAVAASKIITSCNIDGLAASMASLIPMACKKVLMSKYARLMTHLPSGGAWGTAKELRKTADVLDDMTVTACQMYQQKTGLSEAEVMSQFLNDEDNYFNAEQAKKAKLINDTYDGEAVSVPEDKTDYKALWTAYDHKLSASMGLHQNKQPLIIIS